MRFIINYEDQSAPPHAPLEQIIYEPNRTEPTAVSHFNCFKLAENRATSSPWVGSHPTRAFRARQNSYGFRAI